jgi:hypothetical protein
MVDRMMRILSRRMFAATMIVPDDGNRHQEQQR